MRPPTAELARLVRVFDGVLTTAQLAAEGIDAAAIHRRVAAGQWQRLHRGVLYLYSGDVPWRSRALAAVQYAGDDAALSHASAGHLLGFVRRAPETIDVSVPARHRVRPSAGIRVHTRAAMPRAQGWLPVVVGPETALDLVERAATADDAVALLCAAVRAGTRPAAIAAAAAARPRVRHRRLLAELLAEVSVGVESALERRYHHDVELRHGLPTAAFQVRDVVADRRIRADRRYDRYRVRVELDGWLGHPGGRTDDDTWRDNAVLVARGDLTLRYRWRHVAVTPCAVAAQVATALAQGGWGGRATPCGPGCDVAKVSL